jgi:hypothetical protein
MAYKVKKTALENIGKTEWNSVFYNNFRGDRDVVKAASKVGNSALGRASNELKNDKEFVLSLKDALYPASEFNCIGKTLADDKEFLLQVLPYGMSLAIVSRRLRDDKDIVMAAVQGDVHNNREYNLKYASYRLSNDLDIAHASIDKNPLSFEYVSDEIKFNKEFVKKAITLNGQNLTHCLGHTKNDKEMVLLALDNTDKPFMPHHLSFELKSDKDIAIKSCSLHGSYLDEVYKELQNDKDVVLVAVRQDGNALRYVSNSLQNDKDVVLAALKPKENERHFINLSRLIGDELRAELIKYSGGKEPEDYFKTLESMMMRDKLQNSLKVNQPTQQKKFKL